MLRTSSRPSQPTRRASSPGRRRRWLLLAIALLLVVGGVYGYHAYRQHLVSADKARFAQAEKDIADLSSQIVAATGSPLQTKTNKFCSRPSVEFGKGPLSCDVELVSFYGVGNEEDARIIYIKASNAVSMKMKRINIEGLHGSPGLMKFEPIDLPSYINNRDYQRLAETYKSNEGDRNYRLNYTFYKADAPPYSDYLNDSESSFLISIKVGFGDFAKNEYYPLNK